MPDRKTIMIIEDEMMIALHIEDTVTQIGHQVVTATTVAAAERVLETGGIDLAIVDYKLTDGNTEPLMARLQEAAIPFIVCSGISEWDDRQTDSHTPFLAKPFSSDALVDAVTALMGTKRSSDDLH